MSQSLRKLYQTEWCPYCQNVRKKLADMGLRYITINVPSVKVMRGDLFRLSGQRGVPTLVDGDVIIPDDDEPIIAYLEEQYGQAPVTRMRKMHAYV